MAKGITVGIVLLAVTMGMAACSGGAGTQPVKATWITAPPTADGIFLSANDVKGHPITHFRAGSSANMSFMAYELDGKTYIRANICPPCRSTGFSLQGDVLVCDTCGTRFSAGTGDGVSGACVDYPKAAAPFEVKDGKILIKGNDLTLAYQNTLKPGRP